MKKPKMPKAGASMATIQRAKERAKEYAKIQKEREEVRKLLSK